MTSRNTGASRVRLLRCGESITLLSAGLSGIGAYGAKVGED